MGFVFSVAQPQLRQDYNMQALPAPFKSTNSNQILHFILFLNVAA